MAVNKERCPPNGVLDVSACDWSLFTNAAPGAGGGGDGGGVGGDGGGGAGAGAGGTDDADAAVAVSAATDAIANLTTEAPTSTTPTPGGSVATRGAENEKAEETGTGTGTGTRVGKVSNDAPEEEGRDGQTSGEAQGQSDGGAELAQVDWDFIVGSDLIYNEDGTEMLPKVLAGLAKLHTTIIYCHTLYRY